MAALPAGINDHLSTRTRIEHKSHVQMRRMVAGNFAWQDNGRDTYDHIMCVFEGLTLSQAESVMDFLNSDDYVPFVLNYGGSDYTSLIDHMKPWKMSPMKNSPNLFVVEFAVYGTRT